MGAIGALAVDGAATGDAAEQNAPPVTRECAPPATGINRDPVDTVALAP